MLFERIAGIIMGRGVGRSEAEVAALPALRTRLANDVRLAPDRRPTGRCSICGGPEKDAEALLPVMTAKPDVWVWLHAGDCHRAYAAEVSAKVDAVLAAAGMSTSRGASS